MSGRRGDDKRVGLSVFALEELIEQARIEATQGHKRIRRDTDEMDTQIRELTARINRLESKPVEAGKITFSWQIIGSMITGCVLVAGSFFALRSTVNNLEQTIHSEVALQNERLDELKSSTDDLKKNMEMRRIEIQQLREIVTAKTR